MKTAVAPRRGMTLAALLAERGIALPADCGGAGTCGKCRVRVTDDAGGCSVLACQYVPRGTVLVRLPRARPTARRPRPLNAAPSRGSRRDLALAVDLGTTTISLAAVDTRQRRVVRRRDQLNPQVALGADVMSRIAAAARVRRAGVEEVLARFMAETGISRSRPITAVGNTVMSHFLLGRNPSALGAYPYRPVLPLRRVVRSTNGGLRFRMLPLLGSFVGGDCTAAILASGMHRSRDLVLLVDAGTNGEVVLGDRERLLVASTAAGPAFEGAALECGSLAVPGAVKRVTLRRGRFRLATVGGTEPRSICGSGVLDAAAAAVAAGMIDATGRIRGARLVLSPGTAPVYLSQGDVREVQLAKAAIAAAIRILLSDLGAAPEDISRIHVTGRFGAAMNPASAMSLGLLPRLRRPVRQHVNLALAGAVRATLDPGLLAESEAVARRCTEVTLADHPRFEEWFVDGMRLAPWR